jgi:TonB family protein
MSVYLFNPMEELFREEEVRAVFLSDNPELFLPDLDYSPNRLRNLTPRTQEEIPTNTEHNPDPTRDLPPISTGEVEQYLSSLYSKTEELESAEYQINPEIPTRFRLDQMNKSDFTLVIPPESTSKSRQNVGADTSPKELKGVFFPYASVTNRKLSKLLASYRSRLVSPPRTIQSPPKGIPIDLYPWAEKVLEKIDRNWPLVPRQPQESNKTVGITATITKSGEFSNVNVIKSSGEKNLDQSALNALKMSSPLPRLPENFPQKHLVIYIEFEYDD